MEIGISTSSLPRANWNRILNWIKVDRIEIDLRKSFLPKNLDLLKVAFPNYKISLHSRVEFPLNEVDKLILKEDLEIAHALDVKNVVVHISKNADLNNVKNEIKQLNLLVENNSKGTFSSPEEISKFAKETGTKICFDVGHAEIFSERNGMSIVDFFDKVKDFIGEFHLKGTYYEDYDCVFDPRKNQEFSKLILSHPAPKIIETKDLESTLISLDLIKNYKRGV